MTLTHEQAAAVDAPGSVAVVAGAGTGKTHMLTARYLRHVEVDGLSPLAIVATTFTDKAASELRARIRAAGQQRGLAPELLSELEASPIGTLHALAARICREHPEEAGVPPEFQLLEEADSQLWLAEQLDGAIAALPSALFAQIPYALMRDALAALLRDPHAAEAALAAPTDDWETLLAALRREALAALRGAPAWRDAAHTLASCAGADSDKAEANRRLALELVRAIEGLADDARPSEELLQGFKGINLRVGSAKNWPEGQLEAFKAAVNQLREQVKLALDAGLAWELGAADEALRAMLPDLRAAFAHVRAHLDAAKHRARVLDFADLEVGALRALERPEVVAYYAERWKAFMIDEFQDTNPVQAQLLERLTAGATVTIVGDEKQAIYGFRRADVRVFREFRARLKAAGGSEALLATSFRTHAPLVTQLNRLFAPVLGSGLHQDLAGARGEAPREAPHLRLALVDTEEKWSASRRRRIEARYMADEIRRLLDQETPVFDKGSRRLRPLRPGDVAILARTWEPLDAYADALAAAGVPSVHAGGGNLLETREALDGVALLRVLADERDDVALAALLRSPFFAVDDATLYRFAETLPAPERAPAPDAGRADAPESSPEALQGWWAHLAAAGGTLASAHATIAAWRALGRDEAPSRVLQQADRDTGYTAVLANLPGGARREADWRGFLGWVRRLEHGAQSAFQVTRRLRQLLDGEVELPRPPLETGDAVALMTIHKAKGLEWPVVFVPDLARRPANDAARVRFAPERGVALKFELDGEAQDPFLFRWLKREQALTEQAERARVAYVALTRARDHLVLSAAEAKGPLLELLAPGFEAAGLVGESIPFAPGDELAPALPPPAPMEAPATWLLDGLPVRGGRTEWPVTALSEFARCPRAFRHRFVEGHPGLPQGEGVPARTGTLVHWALETGARDPARLAARDPSLPAAAVADAVALLRRHDESPAFEALREGVQAAEWPFSLPLGPLRLNGRVDGVGAGFVLDYKTDAAMHPEDHRFQLWAYARAARQPRALIAYLRHEQVHALEAADLDALESEALGVAEAIARGDDAPTPSKRVCRSCVYGEVCDARA